ncbi:MAG: hypothetical protein KJZ85_15480 [Rhodobacteraceae bacterium]|nr:hypothetical protein [Paracoccaceae bacterium]
MDPVAIAVALAAAALAAALAAFRRSVVLVWASVAAAAVVGAAAMLLLGAVDGVQLTAVIEPLAGPAMALYGVILLAHLLLRVALSRPPVALGRRNLALCAAGLFALALVAAAVLWRAADRFTALPGIPAATDAAGVAALRVGPAAAVANGFLLAGRVLPLPAGGAAGPVLARLPCPQAAGETLSLPLHLALALDDADSGLLPLPPALRDWWGLPEARDGAGGCALHGGDPAVIWFDAPAAARTGAAGPALASGAGPRLVAHGGLAAFRAGFAAAARRMARPVPWLAAGGALVSAGLLAATLAALRRPAPPGLPPVPPAAPRGPGRRRRTIP